jgi:hypothetical protein
MLKSLRMRMWTDALDTTMMTSQPPSGQMDRARVTLSRIARQAVARQSLAMILERMWQVACAEAAAQTAKVRDKGLRTGHLISPIGLRAMTLG